MDSLNNLPENNGTAFDALGNAVNTKIVELIAQQLIRQNNLNLNGEKVHVEAKQILTPKVHEFA